MKFSDIIVLAFTAVRSNKLRASLTLMIIAFGLMALVGILTAVDAMKAGLNSNFATMGSNSFTIRQANEELGTRRRGRKKTETMPINFDQAKMFKERFTYPGIISISAMAGFGTTLQYEKEKTNPTISITGGDENYLQVAGLEVEYGRDFNEKEHQTGEKVVIIGSGVAKKLFNNKPNKAIDKTISIDTRRFRVVGVIKSKGSSSVFSSDDIAVIPIQTCRNLYAGSSTSYVITVAVGEVYEIKPASSEAEGLMRSIRKLKHQENNDFETSTSDELSNLLIEQSGYITSAATIIGLITLLGGAVGLMNIMLVAVAERTREIGVSKALGANNRTVLLQFLTEAILICQLGGLLGMVLGILAGNIVSLFLKGPFVIPWLWLLLGIVNTTPSTEEIQKR